MRVGVVEGAAAAATAVTLCVTALSFSRPAAHEAAAFWRQNIGEGSTTYLNKTRITLNSGQQLVEICISRDRPDRQSKTVLQSYEQKTHQSWARDSSLTGDNASLRQKLLVLELCSQTRNYLAFIIDLICGFFHVSCFVANPYDKES